MVLTIKITKINRRNFKMWPKLCLLVALILVSAHENTATNYCAQISASEANQTVGYFAMQINSGMASYTFSLDLSQFQIKTCDMSNGLVNKKIVGPLISLQLANAITKLHSSCSLELPHTLIMEHDEKFRCRSREVWLQSHCASL